MHTSTVTVAIIGAATTSDIYSKRSDDDFKIEWFSGTGKGGQHRNKHQNSCRVIHLPTGLKQERQGRHRESNLRDAKQAILDMLDQKMQAEQAGHIADSRKSQVGSGMRGDKIRTYREQDDTVKDHRSGKSYQYSRLIKENAFDRLW